MGFVNLVILKGRGKLPKFIYSVIVKFEQLGYNLERTGLDENIALCFEMINGKFCCCC